MTNGIGHNSGMLQRNSLIAGLGQALERARKKQKGTQRDMVTIARHVLALDQMVNGDETLSDMEIQTAGVLLPTDLIANRKEREKARWLARGGVPKKDVGIMIPTLDGEEISDANGLEGPFLTGKRFAKLNTYTGVYVAFVRECKKAIRKALSGVEGVPSLNDIRRDYAGVVFLTETVEGWITAEQDKNTADLQLRRDFKRACAKYIDAAVQGGDLEKLPWPKEVMTEFEAIRVLALQKQQEAEAKKAEVRLPLHQRKLVEESMRHDLEHGVSKQVNLDEAF